MPKRPGCPAKKSTPGRSRAGSGRRPLRRASPSAERRAKRRNRERYGRRAERLAALALRLKGYRIIGKRIRTPAGELDIVARRGATIAFVEVKARRTAAHAAEAISARQRRRITRAAAHYLSANPAFAGLTFRFDVVLVVPRRWPRHLANAWTESAA